jgi:hypothetical protein
MSGSLQSNLTPKKKPIDVWFFLFGTGVGIVFFLLPKTPGVVITCLILLFSLFIHPVWNFWWIENQLWRRISALILLIVGLIYLGYYSWPRVPEKSDQAYILKTEVTYFENNWEGESGFYIVEGESYAIVNAVLFIRIVNLQSVGVALDRLIVKVKDHSGNFVDLTNMALRRTTMKVFCGNPRSIKNKIVSEVVRNTPILTALLQNTILKPNEPIRGWVFLQYPENFSIATPVTFEITITDMNGGSYTFKNTQINGDSDFQQTIFLTLSGENKINLSKLKKMRYTF